jgi:hypothetical protein
MADQSFKEKPTMTKTTGCHATFATALVVAGALAFGTFVAPANAEDHHNGNRGGGGHGYQHGWAGGGYYPAPPIVYGYPGYYPPPVVFGPGVGIFLPGIGINIR